MSNYRIENGPSGKNTQLIRRVLEFDYGDLAASQRNQVQRETAVIRDLLHRTAENVIQVGLRLTGVHGILGRDRFQSWTSTQFGLSQSTASNYMQAARRFCEVKCLEQFQPSALFELARRKATDEARAEALRRALAGEIITKRIAQQIIRAKGTQKPPALSAAVAQVCRTLKALDPKIQKFSPAEAEQVERVLMTLLSSLDEARAIAPLAAVLDGPRVQPDPDPKRNSSPGRKSGR